MCCDARHLVLWSSLAGYNLAVNVANDCDFINFDGAPELIYSPSF